jgi:hypothetical protein
MAAEVFGSNHPAPGANTSGGFLWRRSNNSLVPWFGTAHFSLRQGLRGLSSANRGWVGFLKHSIFEPGEPQSAKLCGFLLPVSLALEERVPEATKDK